MANRQQIESTYDYMDEFFRAAIGENGDITGAMYNGDFSKTLEQAQKNKHDYVLSALKWSPAGRILDIGCGWGPMLKSVTERGGAAVGLTLSTKQAEACKRHGYEVYLKDWREIDASLFEEIDGIVCIGAFEHFCSVDEYLEGRQDQIYQDFFAMCANLLPNGARMYLQTMTWGKNAPEYKDISINARKGSNEYMLAVLSRFYPGSWPPSSEEQIVKAAHPYFRVISTNNGRVDYIETMNQWRLRFSSFGFRKLLLTAKLLPCFLKDGDFWYKLEAIRHGYNRVCFEREVMDHQRIVFEVPSQESAVRL